MGEGSLPFIVLDFLLQEGEFMLSLVLSLNLFVACQLQVYTPKRSIRAELLKAWLALTIG